jgi:hypothetical protein
MRESNMHEYIVADTVTTLGPQARGKPVLAASHCGLIAAYLAAKACVGAVILCDAGIGRERAGIAGLAYLETLGVPAATVGHRSARIGDGADCERRGTITFVNAHAQACGVTPQMSAREALQRLAQAPLAPVPEPAPLTEARHRIVEAEANGIQVSTLDSVSLVTPADTGHIIVTGSHGAILGGRPETAVKYNVFAAIFSDADRGADDAGMSRLPALDARGIAGATVSAFSARIGDGLSIYRDGFVTAVNDTAAHYGGEIGISTRELVARLVATRPPRR